MHIYTIADTAALAALFIAALLTAASYGHWHFWWRNAFGRSFMALMLAFAARTPIQITRIVAPRAGDTTMDVLEMISLAGTVTAAVALGYLLYATVSLNIRRQRHGPVTPPHQSSQTSSRHKTPA